MSMSVAKVSDLVSELTKTATLSLDDAIKKGIAGGNKTLRDVRVWWIKEEGVSASSFSSHTSRKAEDANETTKITDFIKVKEMVAVDYMDKDGKHIAKEIRVR